MVKHHDEFFQKLAAPSPTLNVVPTDFNQLPAAEREGRWQRVRREMAKRGVDCLLINGHSGRWNEMNSNIRYVANYADPLSGEAYALFPLEGDGTLITHWQPKRSAYAMSWFSDIRGMGSSELPSIVRQRLTTLGLTHGTLGLVGIFFRQVDNLGLSWNHLEAIRRELPDLKIVDVTDLFYEMRSLKSDAEIDCLAKSTHLVDLGFEAHVRLARVGMTERELYAGVVQAMDSAGAEPPTFLLLESGPMPYETLTQDPIPSGRVLRRGDVIISETSPKWAGYQAQGLQCVVLGTATPQMRELAKYAAEIWHTCADRIRPGNTPDDAIRAADPIIERARATSLADLADSLRPVLPAAGLAGLDPYSKNAEFRPNQAFMLEIGPGGRPYRPPQHVNGGVLVVSTAGAPRCFFGAHPIEERLLVEV